MNMKSRKSIEVLEVDDSFWNLPSHQRAARNHHYQQQLHQVTPIYIKSSIDAGGAAQNHHYHQQLHQVITIFLKSSTDAGGAAQNHH